MPSEAVRCASEVDFPSPTAPAYVGPGPHPVVVGTELLSYPGLHYRNLHRFDLPIEWRPTDDDESQAQLVICMTAVSQLSDVPLGSCDYEGATKTVFPSSYTFQAFELRTGRSLMTAEIDGDNEDDPFCPGTLQEWVGHSRDILQDIDEEALEDAFEPIVMADLE
jgi:hypothetical protein